MYVPIDVHKQYSLVLPFYVRHSKKIFVYIREGFSSLPTPLVGRAFFFVAREAVLLCVVVLSAGPRHVDHAREPIRLSIRQRYRCTKVPSGRCYLRVNELYTLIMS